MRMYASTFTGAACLALVIFCNSSASALAETRHYYIAAEEVDWDFAPAHRNEMMDMEFNDENKVFVERGDARIGSVYRMLKYVGYTDDTFSEKLEQNDPTLGILGPVIRAEVGDQIEVVFKNMSTKTVSVHPHGVFYDKASEGAPTGDGTSGDDKLDDYVKPGVTYTYHWDVPERAGPGPNDPSSIVWLYHSHVDEIRDTNSGLVGPMVITAKGQANNDGTPKGVDHEFFVLFSVLNQNENLFLDEMIEHLKNPERIRDDHEAFEESNLMHSMNGYVYGSMPMPQMKVGDHVRWYVMTLGTEVDLHTPHWHGNTVLVGGHRKDVVELLPATALTADMEPDDPGIWMFHCHVNDHIAAGMTGRYEVLP